MSSSIVTIRNFTDDEGLAVGCKAEFLIEGVETRPDNFKIVRPPVEIL
jgi:hypothetical protein